MQKFLSFSAFKRCVAQHNHALRVLAHGCGQVNPLRAQWGCLGGLGSGSGRYAGDVLDGGGNERLVEAEGHVAAQANRPPSGTRYDPEGDGIPLPSLGVAEHWNNPTDKQYSGKGIELVYVKAPSLLPPQGR